MYGNENAKCVSYDLRNTPPHNRVDRSGTLKTNEHVLTPGSGEKIGAETSEVVGAPVGLVSVEKHNKIR